MLKEDSQMFQAYNSLEQTVLIRIIPVIRLTAQ